MVCVATDYPSVFVFLIQVVRKDGKLPWIVEKELLCRRLKLLQQAVARLENENHGLEQHNTQLRGTLEQVRYIWLLLPRLLCDLTIPLRIHCPSEVECSLILPSLDLPCCTVLFT